MGNHAFKKSTSLKVSQFLFLAFFFFTLFAGYSILCASFQGMLNGIQIWWISLYLVTLLNLCLWALAAKKLFQKQVSDKKHYRLQKTQLYLSAIYVIGCGFRSLLPRADVQRICLYDSWLSNVLVGRSVATIAELCFAAQWSLFLFQASKDTGSKKDVFLSQLIFPLIVIAEIFSWSAVLTTSYLGNAIEQSLWTFCAFLVLPIVFDLWHRCDKAKRRLLLTIALFSLAFITFMLSVDIPMYVDRWKTDILLEKRYFSFRDGLSDLAHHWVVTYNWEVWNEEIAWMTLYFSIAVWSSIALVHVPRLKTAKKTSH